MSDTQVNVDGAPADAGAPPTTEQEVTVLRVDAAFEVLTDGRRRRKLAKPIRAHNGQNISEIFLRKPRYGEVMNFGDPTALVYLDGGVVPQTDMAVVEKYINSLLVDLEPGLLQQCDYVDALALRDAVLSFFRPTRMRGSISLPTSSYSV